MLSASYIDTLKTNILSVAKPLIDAKLISATKITSTVDVAMRAIFQEAYQGALKAADEKKPEIAREAKRAVTPLLVGTIAGSGIAAILGIVAIAQARKARKGG